MVTMKERDSDDRRLSRNDEADDLLIDDGPEDFELEQDDGSPNDRRRDPLRRP
jgi:hypothetical protein